MIDEDDEVEIERDEAILNCGEWNEVGKTPGEVILAETLKRGAMMALDFIEDSAFLYISPDGSINCVLNGLAVRGCLKTVLTDDLGLNHEEFKERPGAARDLAKLFQDAADRLLKYGQED